MAMLFFLCALVYSNHLLMQNIEPQRPLRRVQLPSCEYFAVATTIFDPSPAVLQMLAAPTWCVVVVGDQKTNDSAWEGYNDERLIFLSYTEQVTELTYAILTSTPANHFARKNIGYLFAIQHGAQMIYDFDDDNVLKTAPEALTEIVNHDRDTWPLCQHHLFNPYPAFEAQHAITGVPQLVWPRGLPLEFVHDNATWDVPLMRSSATTPKIAVYQSLADIDPDVDAVYRMTRPLPIRFTKTDQVLMVPAGSFAPWNAQATLFLPAAFWGLVMPVSVTGRVADIWRSYMTTRLLWLAGFRVAFVSPLVDQYRNPHEYHADLLAERDLYERSDDFIRTLIEMDMSRVSSLSDAYLRMVQLLVQKRFLEQTDYAVAKAWVEDLAVMGYAWPPLAQSPVLLCAPRAPRQVDKRITTLPATTIVSKDTAICVSGQLRTLNLHPNNSDFPQALQPMQTPLTAADMMGLTVAETIAKYLYPAMGSFDVYMSISTLEGAYEPKVNDLSVCDSLRPPPPHRLFCEVIRQEEIDLIAPAVWQTFYYAGQPAAYQGLLQQLYGQQRCARMMALQDVRYQYAVRLRPDMAFFQPMPHIGAMLPKNNAQTIKFVDKSHCCCGNEDTFGIGHFDAMMIYFNRIDALRTDFTKFLENQSPWTAEFFLVEYMRQVHGLELTPEAALVGCLVKPLHRPLNAGYSLP